MADKQLIVKEIIASNNSPSTPSNPSNPSTPSNPSLTSLTPTSTPSTSISTVSTIFNVFSSGASYFTSLIPWTSSQVEVAPKWDTASIDAPFIARLTEGDNYLKYLYEHQKKVQGLLDQAVLATKNVQSRYDNNVEMINRRISDLRNQLKSFANDINKTVETVQTDSNETILHNIGKIADFAQDVKNKLGERNCFEYISLQGTQMSVDYFRAVELNKQILTEIAACKERERPFQAELMRIESEISKVNAEIALIKDFKEKHTKIVTQTPETIISGTPQTLLDPNDPNRLKIRSE